MEAIEKLPLVSVVIPVYNGTNYLSEAVESAFAQTYPNIEVIVVDDGSSDTTWNHILSYGTRVRGIQKENGGVASALNAGIQAAKGEFVAWLSHDDIFYPQKLEQQVQFLNEHPAFGACYTDFEIIDAQCRRMAIYRAPWYPTAELPRRFLQDMHINGATVLFRKSCLDQAGGFNERLAHTQDLEMWLRFSEHNPLGHLPQVLLKSRSHAEQGSLNFAFQIREEQQLFLDLLARLGPERFFPALAQVQDPDQRKAAGLRMLADTLARYRAWYRFALQQCRAAYQIQPGGPALLRIFLYNLLVIFLGSEHDTLVRYKKARISLGQGKPLLARQLCKEIILRHPLRLDAWAVWISSWIPDSGYDLLRKVKRGVRNASSKPGHP